MKQSPTWRTKKKYCDQAGFSPHTYDKWIKTGFVTHGIHYKILRRRTTIVNVPAMDKLLEREAQ